MSEGNTGYPSVEEIEEMIELTSDAGDKWRGSLEAPPVAIESPYVRPSGPDIAPGSIRDRLRSVYPPEWREEVCAVQVGTVEYHFRLPEFHIPLLGMSLVGGPDCDHGVKWDIPLEIAKPLLDKVRFGIKPLSSEAVDMMRFVMEGVSGTGFEAIPYLDDTRWDSVQEYDREAVLRKVCLGPEPFSSKVEYWERLAESVPCAVESSSVGGMEYTSIVDEYRVFLDRESHTGLCNNLAVERRVVAGPGANGEPVIWHHPTRYPKYIFSPTDIVVGEAYAQMFYRYLGLAVYCQEYRGSNGARALDKMETLLDDVLNHRANNVDVMSDEFYPFLNAYQNHDLPNSGVHNGVEAMYRIKVRDRKISLGNYTLCAMPHVFDAYMAAPGTFFGRVASCVYFHACLPWTGRANHVYASPDRYLDCNSMYVNRINNFPIWYGTNPYEIAMGCLGPFTGASSTVLRTKRVRLVRNVLSDSAAFVVAREVQFPGAPVILDMPHWPDGRYRDRLLLTGWNYRPVPMKGVACIPGGVPRHKCPMIWAKHCRLGLPDRKGVIQFDGSPNIRGEWTPSELAYYQRCLQRAKLGQHWFSSVAFKDEVDPYQMFNI